MSHPAFLRVALAALLILYAYHKGQLDKNHNGIPDFLEDEGPGTKDHGAQTTDHRQRTTDNEN